MVSVRAGRPSSQIGSIAGATRPGEIVVVKKLAMIFAAAALLAPCAAAQVPPPSIPIPPVRPPIAYIEPDSGERQTLPAYRITCDLRDAAGRLSEVLLVQSGGRGIAATQSQLRSLPVLQRFVSTKVDIQVAKDTGGIFYRESMDTVISTDQYRWDVRAGRGESVTLRDDPKSYIEFTFAGSTPGSDTNLIAPVIVSRRSYGGRPSASHVGFCAVETTAQQPLSAAEAAEYRRSSD